MFIIHVWDTINNEIIVVVFFLKTNACTGSTF